MTTLYTTLSNSGVIPGSYTRVTVDAKGRVVNGTNIQFSGDASGTITGTSVRLTLSTTGVTSSTYGGSLQIPIITVDGKGRITAARAVTLTNTISLIGNSGTSVYTLGNSIQFFGVRNQIDTTVAGNLIIFGLPTDLNLTGNVTARTFIGTLTSANAVISGGAINSTPVGLTYASSGTFTVLQDQIGNVRSSPINLRGSAYTLLALDNGKTVVINIADITIPASVMPAGSLVTIYNNSTGTRSIICDPNLTMVLANIGSTGTRTISSYGLATIVFITPNAAVISGQGVS